MIVVISLKYTHINSLNKIQFKMSEENIVQILSTDEYEIQHYDFSSSSFINEFKEFVMYTIKSIHKDIENCIAKKLNLSVENIANLHTEIEILTENYKKSAEECIKQKELIIRNFFAIPTHIILEEDKVHHDVREENLDDLIKEITKLEQEYIKEKSVCCLYNNELKEILKVSVLQEQIPRAVKYLNSIPDERETLNKLNDVLKDVSQKIRNDCNIKLKLKRYQKNFNKTSEKVLLDK